MPLVDRAIAASPNRAEAYRQGRIGLMDYFMGQVMKETGGSANPRW